MFQQTRSIEINAPAQKCFDVICDFASYPKWQKSMREVRILEQNGTRPSIVEYKLETVVQSLTYTLRYSYETQAPELFGLSWTYVRGDLKNIEGKYTFKALGAAKTATMFQLSIEIGRWVPNFILKTFQEGSMQETLESLKRRVESLQA